MAYDEHNEPPELRSFAAQIAACTGCDPSDIHRVERLMVDELGMRLDQVHPDHFADHARRLYRFLVALRQMSREPDATARVLGISRAEFDLKVERYLGDQS
jgi:hypothetical protein